MSNGQTVFKLVFTLVLFSKTLEGCYSVSNGHAAFKLVFKLVLFSKTLEGCYSMSNGHAAFKCGQFVSFSKLCTMALVSDWKETCKRFDNILGAILEDKDRY